MKIKFFHGDVARVVVTIVVVVDELVFDGAVLGKTHMSKTKSEN